VNHRVDSWVVDRFGLLQERQFRLLFIGRTVSMLGSAMAPVALAFAVLDTLRGSASDIGIVLACRQVPVVLLILLGGVWGDRLPRNVVMVASNVLSGASQAAAAALLLAGRAQLWELAVLAVANGASSAFFFPASAGVVPLTVSPPLLQQANAALRLGLNATTIAGAALGGLLVAATNPGVAILLDAVSYLVAAVALRWIRLPLAMRAAGASVAHDLRLGWRDFRSRGWLWAIVVQFGLVNAVESGSINVLGPGVAKAYFGGAAGWGLVLTAQTVGLVVSGLLMLRWKPRRILLTATFGAFGLALPPLVLARPLPLGGVLAAGFLAGVGMEVFGVLWQTAMQQEIPTEMLSRLSSYDALGSWALIPVGSALAAPVASVIGTSWTFVTAAAVVVLATGLVLLSRDVRTLERRGADLGGAPSAGRA
jgi:MFS family permease